MLIKQRTYNLSVAMQVNVLIKYSIKKKNSHCVNDMKKYPVSSTTTNVCPSVSPQDDKACYSRSTKVSLIELVSGWSRIFSNKMYFAYTDMTTNLTSSKYRQG